MLSIGSLRIPTYLVHIEDWENGSCHGTVFDPLNQHYYRFNSLAHLLLSLEILCEINNFPTREDEPLRTFPDHILQPIAFKPHKCKGGNFHIEVLYRQHNSLQGKVSFNLAANKIKTICFRSELELMTIIHSCYSQKSESVAMQEES